MNKMFMISGVLLILAVLVGVTTVVVMGSESVSAGVPAAVSTGGEASFCGGADCNGDCDSCTPGCHCP